MHFVVKEAINSKIGVIKVLLVKYVKNVHAYRAVGPEMRNPKFHLQYLRGTDAKTQQIHFTGLGFEK